MNWPKSKTPAKEQDIQAVERKFGIQFPDDYREVAKISHGEMPDPYSIDFGGMFGKIFGFLLSFDKKSPINIERVYDDIKDALPEKVFPFAEDRFGNFYCFDYRHGNDPIIVYWYHETFRLTKVCNHFSEIEDMLYEFDFDDED